MRVRVQAPAVIGPGLPDWDSALPVLRGQESYQAAAVPRPAVGMLPANERRRLTPTIRLALSLAEAGTRGLDAAAMASLPTVFASMAGDIDVADRLCTALSTPERSVSPTQFHNSVHNAAAGYWAIATGSRAASTSVAAGDGTAAAGLLEAASRCVADGDEVLLLVYDVAPPELLAPHTGVAESFGVALRLGPETMAPAGEAWVLELDLAARANSRLEGVWEGLRTSNPAARLLPLLQALAEGGGEVVLPCSERQGLVAGVSRGA